MNKTQMNKMTLGRMKRTSSRVNISHKGIKIKSYEHGFILDIGSDPSRYYSSLQDLFKALYSIKTTRKSATSLKQLEVVQLACLKEIREVVYNLEQIMKGKFK